MLFGGQGDGGLQRILFSPYESEKWSILPTVPVGVFCLFAVQCQPPSALEPVDLGLQPLPAV